MAKILLVEDDKSLREIYGVRLMAEGYTITSAGDGEEALAVAIKERPDLIVSDVMMPKISGFDMLDILRSTTETKDVKVIMMTALSSDDQRARGEALGADRYLVKSQVGIEDVVRTVHDVLGDGVAGGATVAAPTFGPGTAPAAPLAPAPIAPAAPVADPLAAVPAAPALDPIAAPAATVPGLVAPDLTAAAPVAAVPAAPAFDPLAVAPIAPAAPVAPEPIAPNPYAAPAADPLANSAYAAPAPVEVAPAPAAPIATPAFDPLAVAPIAPAAPAPLAPIAPEAPAAPVFTTPAPAGPGTINELPAAPAPLPQPTAPFSSPAPASLGERVIEPLTNLAPQGPVDLSAQMEQALNTPVAPAPGVPPTPPAL